MIVFQKIFEELTFLGGILFSLIIFLFFLIKKQFFYSFVLFTGLFLIYFLTFVIRIFYFKNRPKKVRYSNFLEKIDASSFPSVHAARATFLFLFFLTYFIKSLLITFLLLSLCFLVYYSRIFLKKHDYIDVLAGILLGIVSFLPFLIMEISTIL